MLAFFEEGGHIFVFFAIQYGGGIYEKNIGCYIGNPLFYIRPFWFYKLSKRSKDLYQV